MFKNISFNTISRTEAESIHLAKIQNKDLPDIEPVKLGSGDIIFSNDNLYRLREELVPIKDKFPEKLPEIKGNKFDLEILPIIHKFFEEFPLTMLTSAGFWRWLSIMATDGYFYELIEWRFKSYEEKIVNSRNWGIADDNMIVEYYFYYCWLRACVGYEETRKNKYEIAKLGDADFWRSHIFRQDYGKDRILVKAILIVLFEDLEYKSFYKGNKLGLSKTDTIRKIFIPEIRSWYAGGSFSHLSFDECIEVVKIICDIVKEKIN